MKKKILFWISLAFTLVLFVSISLIDESLKIDETANGIVSFECAKTLGQSEYIIQSWEAADVMIYAALSLGIDYLFMVAYGSFFALAVLLLAEKLPSGFLKKEAKLMAFFMLLAALLDGIENFGLIQLLINTPTQSMVSLAFYCASIKFGLLGIGVLYLLAGIITLGLKKRTVK
jgi:hypothetical protein